MKRIEIKTKEYKMLNAGEDAVLYTRNLNEELAFSFFSSKLKKVALSRNIDKYQLVELLKEMNPNNIQEPGLIRVQIIGGLANSVATVQYLKHLIEEFVLVDNNRNIINIVSLDTGARLHPNSFEVDCYHGGVRAMVLNE